MSGSAIWRPAGGGSPSLDVALWNVLVSHLGAVLPLGQGRTCRFDAAAVPRSDAAAARLRLSSGQEVVLVPVAFPFATAHGAEIAVADLPVLPPVLRDALTEGIASTIAAAMPLSASPEIAALGPLAEMEAGPAWPWFRATIAGIAPEPVVADLSASAADLRAVFGEAPLRRVRDDLAARLVRPVDATLARMRVVVSALRGWREGTVVVFDGSAAGHALRLRCGAHFFDFEPRDGAWLCGAKRDALREGRSEMAVGPEDDRRAIDVGTLEVDVDFDLGRAEVSLAEIEGWRPGSLVALPAALTDEPLAVTLRVNGRAVGTGDVVSIDGRLAVRLSSLAF